MKEAVMDFVIGNTYQDRQGDKIKVLDIAENPHDILMDTIKRKEMM